MFSKDFKLARDGGLSVAVPGELRGLFLAHSQLTSGVLPWSQLVAPAAKLAKKWPISAQLHASFGEIKEQMASGGDPIYSPLRELFTKTDGSFKDVGDYVMQPLLAHTLEMVGLYGPDYIYKTMAANLSSDIIRAGGIITQADIQNYQPIVHSALSTEVMGHTYLGVGGSSSGGFVPNKIVF
jgi:gamma-glutamyltranspeptidase